MIYTYSYGLRYVTIPYLLILPIALVVLYAGSNTG
jgi:hypothetical protein